MPGGMSGLVRIIDSMSGIQFLGAPLIGRTSCIVICAEHLLLSSFLGKACAGSGGSSWKLVMGM